MLILLLVCANSCVDAMCTGKFHREFLKDWIASSSSFFLFKEKSPWKAELVVVKPTENNGYSELIPLHHGKVCDDDCCRLIEFCVYLESTWSTWTSVVYLSKMSIYLRWEWKENIQDNWLSSIEFFSCLSAIERLSNSRWNRSRYMEFRAEQVSQPKSFSKPAFATCLEWWSIFPNLLICLSNEPQHHSLFFKCFVFYSGVWMNTGKRNCREK